MEKTKITEGETVSSMAKKTRRLPFHSCRRLKSVSTLDNNITRTDQEKIAYLTKSLIDNEEMMSVLYQENEKLLKEVELLCEDKKSIDSVCSDYEFIIKQSEEQLFLIFDKLLKHLPPNSIKLNKLLHMKLFHKIMELNKLMDKILDPNSKTQGETKSLDNKELQESSTKIFKLSQKKPKLKQIKLECANAGVMDNKSDASSMVVLLHKQLQDALETLENERRALAVLHKENCNLALKIEESRNQLHMETSVTAFWRNKAEESSHVYNVNLTKAEQLENIQLTQKLLYFYTANTAKLQRESMYLVSKLAASFKTDILSHKILSQILPPLLGCDLEESMDKFKNVVCYIVALFDFIGDVMLSKSSSEAENSLKLPAVDEENQVFPSVSEDFLVNVNLIDEANINSLTIEEIGEKFNILKAHLSFNFITTSRRFNAMKYQYALQFTEYSDTLTRILDNLESCEKTPSILTALGYVRFLNVAIYSLCIAAKCSGALQYEEKMMICWQLLFKYIEICQQKKMIC